MVSLWPVPNLPEVTPYLDLGRVLVQALHSADFTLHPHDIIAIAQKIVSKAENRFVTLSHITPSDRAHEIAQMVQKDPRLVELILRESKEVSRLRAGVLIVRHRLGFVCANAGIDRSNVPQGEDGEERVLLLPENPDDSAERIRQTLQTVFGVPLAVVITDSHGRPHRLGTVGVAIGVAGLPAMVDKRGTLDRYGYALQHTEIAFADEVAAAAGLVMGQAAESTPVVVVRGLDYWGYGQAADLHRPTQYDLYR